MIMELLETVENYDAGKKSIRISADLDSHWYVLWLQALAFCLPLMQIQCIDVSQATCNLEDKIHMPSMKECENRSLDSFSAPLMRNHSGFLVLTSEPFLLDLSKSLPS